MRRRTEENTFAINFFNGNTEIYSDGLAKATKCYNTENAFATFAFECSGTRHANWSNDRWTGLGLFRSENKTDRRLKECRGRLNEITFRCFVRFVILACLLFRPRGEPYRLTSSPELVRKFQQLNGHVKLASPERGRIIALVIQNSPCLVLY